MSLRPIRLRVFMLTAVLLIGVAMPAFAADNAKGTLTMTSEGKPVSQEITHVYYITGPDAFAPELTTRRLIFATQDTHAAIAGCESARCAMSSIGNGLTVELEADTPMARWWAHIRPTQQSGIGNRSMLSLATDTAERVAGTLKIDSLGVKTTIVFDVALAKAFTASP